MTQPSRSMEEQDQCRSGELHPTRDPHTFAQCEVPVPYGVERIAAADLHQPVNQTSASGLSTVQCGGLIHVTVRDSRVVDGVEAEPGRKDQCMKDQCLQDQCLSDQCLKDQCLTEQGGRVARRMQQKGS